MTSFSVILWRVAGTLNRIDAVRVESERCHKEAVKQRRAAGVMAESEPGKGSIFSTRFLVTKNIGDHR
ncbi:MAG: hypothetical protein A4E19_10695 [Nitrospira sp. SG-bin1]|nr:MAG: hypothetical protein A4E19_10695 [Nitrospira sp. SG-bin1]